MCYAEQVEHQGSMLSPSTSTSNEVMVSEGVVTHLENHKGGSDDIQGDVLHLEVGERPSPNEREVGHCQRSLALREIRYLHREVLVWWLLREPRTVVEGRRIWADVEDVAQVLRDVEVRARAIWPVSDA